MSLDRRELLRFFGIGATITPVLGGKPIVERAAKLLAEPSIAPVLVDSFPKGHDPQHFKERLKWNPYEEIWLRMWQIENNPGPGLNGGIGPLEHILKREPTAAEKAAVAGVIMWFGSNCGHGFIDESLRACGFRVNFDEKLPQSREIRNLQHVNIWGKEKTPQVHFVRHGRKFQLGVGV